MGRAQDVIEKLLRIRFTWASRAGRLAGDATTPATTWIRWSADWTKNVLFVFWPLDRYARSPPSLVRTKKLESRAPYVLRMKTARDDPSVIGFEQSWTKDCRTNDGDAESTIRTVWQDDPAANWVATTFPVTRQAEGYESEKPTRSFVSVRHLCASLAALG
jgi:hypothetical protein